MPRAGDGDVGGETMIVPGRRPPRRGGGPQGRHARRLSVWPLILLLAGLALLALILAAIFTFTGPGEELKNFGKKKTGVAAATAKPVTLTGVTAYDPYGDGTEHDPSVGNATDGDPATYWNDRALRRRARTSRASGSCSTRAGRRS